MKKLVIDFLKKWQ
ncbi:hypothetical protein FPR_04690 [Faecalibacterium prausnitzii SL3/3]|uniref:Uncharacterized protein n=1 Tax=Faecalibacterium prausnitzii SL3/3 TaxID=657322 RepID=D4K7R0_9FIRM|nr:hypothetical protein FPR_04690 [Faecalibacterium prausnitzii SL3/3]